MPVTTRMSSLNTSSGCVWMMRTYSRIFPRAWLGLFPQLSSSDAAKPPLWRAASELCQPCPHGALVIPKVHPFRIIYPVPTDGRVRIARNPKRLPQLNSSGAWENPIRGERVLHLVNLFNTGCCSLPSPVHSYSSTSSKKWVRVARKPKQLNTVLTFARSGSSTMPKIRVRIARNAKRIIYNRLIVPLTQLRSRRFRIINGAKQTGESC